MTVMFESPHYLPAACSGVAAVLLARAIGQLPRWLQRCLWLLVASLVVFSLGLLLPGGTEVLPWQRWLMELSLLPLPLSLMWLSLCLGRIHLMMEQQQRDRQTAQDLGAIIDACPYPVTITAFDQHGCYQRDFPAWRQFFQIPTATTVGHNFYNLTQQYLQEQPEWRRKNDWALETERPFFHLNPEHIRIGDEDHWMIYGAAPWKRPSGDVAGLVFVTALITPLQRSRLRMRQWSMFDDLTGLASRRALGETHHSVYGVVIFDLNNFKACNVTYGQQVGNQVLRIVAARIVSSLHSQEIPARLGSDEFAVVIERPITEYELISLARRVVTNIELEDCLVGNCRVELSVSAGCALREMGEEVERLLTEAEIALSMAKSNGLGRDLGVPREPIELYRRWMQEKIDRQTTSEAELDEAIQQQQIVLYYQPIVSLQKDGYPLVGFEALARWYHPHRGLISPNEFVPLAIRTGLISPLFDWLFSLACRQISTWRHRYPVPISLNVLPAQVAHKSFVYNVQRILADTGVDPACFILEITEDEIPKTEPGRLAEHLAELQQLGFRVAIDDFGTGYSSLPRLAHLPLDGLKIDRLFMPKQADWSMQKVCRGIIQTAHSFNLQVTAEGVESIEQAVMLRSLGCDFAQGFYFRPPLTPQDVERLY